MAADDAARGSPQDAVMTSKVPGSSAHQRTLDAPFGLGRYRYAHKRKRHRRAPKQLFHQLLLIVESICRKALTAGCRYIPVPEPFLRSSDFLAYHELTDN